MGFLLDSLLVQFPINVVYLSVNVFSTKVLIGDTNFYVFYWRRDYHFRWSSDTSYAKVYPAFAGQKKYLSYFKTLSIWESNPRPPALQSSALPIELTLARLDK